MKEPNPQDLLNKTVQHALVTLLTMLDRKGVLPLGEYISELEDTHDFGEATGSEAENPVFDLFISSMKELVAVQEAFHARKSQKQKPPEGAAG
jgi:hypothetical protein